MRWSKLKKRIESLLAESVKGRVELRSVCYRGAHDDEGRGYISIDGQEVWSACTITYELESMRLSSEVSEGGREAIEVRTIVAGELEKRGICGQHLFYAQLEAYISAPIALNLDSKAVLIRALAMLDRRVGKRTLERLDVSGDHELVQRLYQFRCKAEQFRPDVKIVEP